MPHTTGPLEVKDPLIFVRFTFQPFTHTDVLPISL